VHGGPTVVPAIVLRCRGPSSAQSQEIVLDVDIGIGYGPMSAHIEGMPAYCRPPKLSATPGLSIGFDGFASLLCSDQRKNM
jgi:hypothetical protein